MKGISLNSCVIVVVCFRTGTLRLVLPQGQMAFNKFRDFVDNQYIEGPFELCSLLQISQEKKSVLPDDEAKSITGLMYALMENGFFGNTQSWIIWVSPQIWLRHPLACPDHFELPKLVPKVITSDTWRSIIVQFGVRFRNDHTTGEI